MNRTRTENINIQRFKGAKTNQLKGILTFIKSQNKKADLLHNNIIDELVNNKYYELLYNKYILDKDFNDNINNVPDKDFSILEMFDYCDPSELKDKYKGFYVSTI